MMSQILSDVKLSKAPAQLRPRDYGNQHEEVGAGYRREGFVFPIKPNVVPFKTTQEKHVEAPHEVLELEEALEPEPLPPDADLPDDP